MFPSKEQTWKEKHTQKQIISSFLPRMARGLLPPVTEAGGGHGPSLAGLIGGDEEIISQDPFPWKIPS